MHKLPNGTRIPNVKALNDAIDDGNTSFAILLGGGLFSRKTITRESKVYRIEHHIDDAIDRIHESQFFDKGYTNIGEAMKKGAFVVCDP